MHLLFLHHFSPSDQIELNDDDIRHIKAWRLRDGDALWATDGKGNRYDCILRGDLKQAFLEVGQKTEMPTPKAYLHLAIAPTKNPDRIEWLVEKAIEIGINKITLIECEHSERSPLKMDRLERLAIAALKQSQRYFLPEIFSMTFSELVQKNSGGCIAHCHTEIPRVLLHTHLQGEQSALIAIGPEGDFSKNEIEMALAHHWTSITLGESRLRTETAALVAVTTFQNKQLV